MALPQRVKIVEVGPRDGLQNEKEFVPTAIKIELINRLSAAGFRNVEAASFVSPKWVPQMADGADVMAGIERRAGHDLLGADAEPARLRRRARRACGRDRDFRRRQRSVLAEEHQLQHRGKHRSIRARRAGGEGTWPADSRQRVVRARLSVSRRSAGGVGGRCGRTFRGARLRRDRYRRHDRRRHAEAHARSVRGSHARCFRANVCRAISTIPTVRRSRTSTRRLQEGIEIYHASVAGLGGCPYAKGATGNVATEDVLYLMNGLGIETGIDLAQVVAIGDFISTSIGRPNVSRAGKALLAKARSEQANCV